MEHFRYRLTYHGHNSFTKSHCSWFYFTSIIINLLLRYSQKTNYLSFDDLQHQPMARLVYHCLLCTLISPSKCLTLLHLEWPKLHRVLAILSAIALLHSDYVWAG